MGRKKKEVMLPDLQGITVTHSNRVTNAIYEYTIMQERVFTWVMYHLQGYINDVMSGKQVVELDLFRPQSDTFMITIPMNVIGKPSQYGDIRLAVEKIAGILVRMHNVERETVKIAGLFSSVEMPDKEKNKRSNKVVIEMRHDVAKLLIDVDKNDRNRPAQYTKYMLHTAINAQCKHSSRIYKLLCSYREKQIYTIKLEKFRDFLQIPPDLYTDFYDFKRFILAPVAKELKAIADCFFDINDPELVIREGRKVVGLKFNILEPMSEEMHTNKKKILLWELTNRFGCKPYHLQKIDHLITKDTNWKQVNGIVDRCYYLCTRREVDYPAAHIVRALINELAPE